MLSNSRVSGDYIKFILCFLNCQMFDFFIEDVIVIITIGSPVVMIADLCLKDFQFVVQCTRLIKLFEGVIAPFHQLLEGTTTF